MKLLTSLRHKFLNACQSVSEFLGYYIRDWARHVQGFFAEKVQKYVLTTLTDRALKSPEGYARSKLFNRTIFVIVDKDKMQEAIDYGEISRAGNEEGYDPQARMYFDVMKEFQRYELMVNRTGPKVYGERKQLMEHLSPRNAAQIAQIKFSDYLNNNAERISIDTLTYTTIQTITHMMFNIDLDETQSSDVSPLISQHKKVIFKPWSASKTEINQLWEKMKAKGDEITKKNILIFSQDNNFLKQELEYRKEREINEELTLEDMNMLVGFLVTDNLNLLIYATVIKITSDAILQGQLRKELRKLDQEELACNRYEALKTSPFLRALFLESLRFFSPTALIARHVSKTNQMIGNIPVPKNSDLFVPLRRILLSPVFGAQPLTFNPHRFITKEGNIDKALQEYAKRAFGVGMRRCPSINGFAEAIFLSAIAEIFQNYELQLIGEHKTFEEISPFCATVELEQQYSIKHTPVKNEEVEEKSKTFTPTYRYRSPPNSPPTVSITVTPSPLPSPLITALKP